MLILYFLSTEILFVCPNQWVPLGIRWVVIHPTPNLCSSSFLLYTARYMRNETSRSRRSCRFSAQRVRSGKSENSGYVILLVDSLRFHCSLFVDMSIAPLNVGANTNNTALVIGYVYTTIGSSALTEVFRERAFLLIAEDLGISLESETISHSLKNLSLCAHLNGNWVHRNMCSCKLAR